VRILSDSHYYSIILCRKCRLCNGFFCLLVYFLFKICISFLLIDSLSCWRSIILSLKRGSVSLGKKWESPWRFSPSSLQGARVCCVSTSEYTCEWSWKIVQRSYYRRQMIHCEKKLLNRRLSSLRLFSVRCESFIIQTLAICCRFLTRYGNCQKFMLPFLQTNHSSRLNKRLMFFRIKCKQV